HFLGIGHLRHALGMYKTADFETPDPGIEGTGDELDLDGCRQNLGLALESVAGSDFNDRNVLCLLAHGLTGRVNSAILYTGVSDTRITVMANEQKSVAGPLAGLRLVEMGTLLAGPFCGQLMGD